MTHVRSARSSRSGGNRGVASGHYPVGVSDRVGWSDFECRRKGSQQCACERRSSFSKPTNWLTRTLPYSSVDEWRVE